MGGAGKNILCVNGGSSSVKFSVYGMDEGGLGLRLRGEIDRIGQQGAELTYTDIANKNEGRAPVGVDGAGADNVAAGGAVKGAGGGAVKEIGRAHV